MHILKDLLLFINLHLNVEYLKCNIGQQVMDVESNLLASVLPSDQLLKNLIKGFDFKYICDALNQYTFFVLLMPQSSSVAASLQINVWKQLHPLAINQISGRRG